MGSALTRVYSPAELSWVAINKPNGYDETDGKMAICKPCMPGCKTCTLEPEDEVLDKYDTAIQDTIVSTVGSNRGDQCTSCYAGWYFEATTSWTDYYDGEGLFNGQYGTCEPCHCSCSACTGPGEHECLYCLDDRTLVHKTIEGVEGDYCMCKDDTVSDNFYACLNACPATMWPDDDNWCVADEELWFSPSNNSLMQHWHPEDGLAY